MEPGLPNSFGLLSVVVDRTHVARCDPASRSAGWRGDANQKNGVIAGCRNARKLSGKVGIALTVERYRSGVQNRLRGASSTANQRAVDRSDRSRSSAGIAAIQDQAFDIEERVSVGKVYPCVSASHRPGTRSGVNPSNRIVDAWGGDDSTDTIPTNDGFLGPTKCRCGAQAKRNQYS